MDIFTTDSTRGRLDGVGIGAPIARLVARLGVRCEWTMSPEGVLIVVCGAGCPRPPAACGTLQFTVRDSIVVAVVWAADLP
jgi:hypothetical protein